MYDLIPRYDYMIITSVLSDVRGPRDEVAPKKLHDQSVVFVWILLRVFEFWDSFTKRLIR